LAGIYLHIPFCKSKCHYCNFFSLASQKLKVPFLPALEREIDLTREYLGGETVQTIYFGGGTPSLYSPMALQGLMERVTSPPGPSPGGYTSPPDPSPAGEGRIVRPADMEITIELNPEDVTEEYVAGLRKTWFNRFSLGVQSFDDGDLRTLNRAHSAAQSMRAVTLLKEAGYGNISIDLIYGIPGSESSGWEKNLEIAFSLGVPHISAYALTVEARTPLAWMIERKKSAPVSDELQEKQFRTLVERTKANGYLQYEISNFCKPGHHAIHNTNYWNGVPYLGLGPSAHSYDGRSRRWNISSLSGYITAISKGEPVFESEQLTPDQRYNEYVMTSLRTMWGCNGKKIIFDFGITIYDLFKKGIMPMIGQGWVTKKEEVYYLTDEGKLFADRVASALFITG